MHRMRIGRTGRSGGRSTRPARARDGDPVHHGERRLRVALVADGPEEDAAAAALVAQVREHAVPGCRVEVLGTDAGADRRLDLCEEVAIPLHPGRAIGVPGVAGVTAALEGADVVHLCAPGPAGVI